jgi:hypothetical protein
MSTIWIQKFRDGLDARRLPETTNSGALVHAVDGHITRGGEFEKRAAFVSTYTLPAGTASLAATANSIYVFGEGVEPVGMPAGVAYQQLSNSGDPLTKVISWSLFEGLIYCAAEFDSGDVEHYYDGSQVSRIGRSAFVFLTVSGGGPGDTIDIDIDGVSITGGPVAWTTSDDVTAAAVANAINTTFSSPDYIAISLLSLLAVFAADTGIAANGLTLTAVTTGAVSVTPSPTTLEGGVEPYKRGTRYVRTIGTKEYSLSESDLEFSSIGDPLDWDGEFGGVGFGFIDTSSYTSGSEDLTAVVEFRDAGAVFSQRTIQIWQLEPDPDDNVLRQRLRNTGTSCPKSITQFGDGDIFYLDESGLRSLRARGSSTAASTYGVGVKIDPLIVAKLRSLTEDERSLVVGLIEPATGNFWLIMKDTIFVYAYFEEERVSGWTTYLPGFTVDDAVVFNRRVYLRSDDTIYVYGGLETGQETDATVAECWTAYQDGEDPTQLKSWQAFDAAVSGEWAVAVGTSLRDTDEEDDICIISRTTYNDERIGLFGRSTHASLRFRSRGTGAATVGACALHYE